MQYLVTEKTRLHYAHCRCGWRSDRLPTQQQVVDEVMDHQKKIEKLRASLGGQPTLKSQRDWFQSQADDPHVPAKDRRLWQQLADEITHRLNDTVPADQDQSRLW
jgi:hypothetical protein